MGADGIRSPLVTSCDEEVSGGVLIPGLQSSLVRVLGERAPAQRLGATGQLGAVGRLGSLSGFSFV